MKITVIFFVCNDTTFKYEMVQGKKRGGELRRRRRRGARGGTRGGVEGRRLLQSRVGFVFHMRRGVTVAASVFLAHSVPQPPHLISSAGVESLLTPPSPLPQFIQSNLTPTKHFKSDVSTLNSIS